MRFIEGKFLDYYELVKTEDTLETRYYPEYSRALSVYHIYKSAPIAIWIGPEYAPAHYSFSVKGWKNFVKSVNAADTNLNDILGGTE